MTAAATQRHTRISSGIAAAAAFVCCARSASAMSMLMLDTRNRRWNRVGPDHVRRALPSASSSLQAADHRTPATRSSLLYQYSAEREELN